MEEREITRCKCNHEMRYLLGNSGLRAYWCPACGRVGMADNGVIYEWLESELAQLVKKAEPEAPPELRRAFGAGYGPA